MSNVETPKISPAFHPLAIGNHGDALPTPEQVREVASLLTRNGICYCFVMEYALIYYGAHRVANTGAQVRAHRVFSSTATSTHLVAETGGLPYPKLQVYVQSLIDSRNLVDLEDLVDGMDLSEEWGEQSLDLNGSTDAEWARNYIKALEADKARLIYIDPEPTPKREIWQECVQNKQRRMGWKYPPEIYATRFRKFGSKDPRLSDRPGL
ncbi:hypothetical protein PRK78_001766 [Emydomyces testavorans]|uniref:Uncharacterized protein n=1 Tax=Emydomyces testavorans TaxID=2070801 RepID=A0AAF0IH02_9EURO|nr:hypothetical protein PRK78_001766 [Emydomyces testavorans]